MKALNARGLLSLVLLLSVIPLNCGHGNVPALASDYCRPEPGIRDHVDSMSATIQELSEAPSNLDRYEIVLKKARELKLEHYLYTETIDWFTFQRNIIIELPGRSHEIVYLLAHYDKSGITPLVLLSLLSNGLLDEPLFWSYTSQGSIDNASGVAIVLELAAVINQMNTERTYRILLSGAEETGIRGSRAHVSRMSDADWERTTLVVNVDAVGSADTENCVTTGVSEDYLVYRLMRVAQRLQIPINKEDQPALAGTDSDAFKSTSCLSDCTGSCLKYNLSGGLIPQRSWFVPSRRKAVVSFLTCDAYDLGQLVGSTCLIPTGRFHGPRDNVKSVSPSRLYEQYYLVLEFLLDLERDLAPTSRFTTGNTSEDSGVDKSEIDSITEGPELPERQPETTSSHPSLTY